MKRNINWIHYWLTVEIISNSWTLFNHLATFYEKIIFSGKTKQNKKIKKEGKEKKPKGQVLIIINQA